MELHGWPACSDSSTCAGRLAFWCDGRRLEVGLAPSDKRSWISTSEARFLPGTVTCATVMLPQHDMRQ